MGSGRSGLYSGATSAIADTDYTLAVSIKEENTSEVWKHIQSTQPVYAGTVIPKSFVIDTPQGKMWTHGNATEHMNEAVTSIKQNAPRIINSNPNMYSQFILYDYWKSLGRATNGGIKYGKLIRSGKWEFIFSKPRKSGEHPVVKHAQFFGLQ